MTWWKSHQLESFTWTNTRGSDLSDWKMVYKDDPLVVADAPFDRVLGLAAVIIETARICGPVGRWVESSSHTKGTGSNYTRHWFCDEHGRLKFTRGP